MRDKQILLGMRNFMGDKTRRLNIDVRGLSDQHAFSISPIVPIIAPDGKLIAIRVQDLKTGEWFNWDDGVWSRAPEVTIGANLYIAAYAINEGGYEMMQLLIKDDAGSFLAVTQAPVGPGGSIGVETGTIEMPDRNYGILVLVEP